MIAGAQTSMGRSDDALGTYLEVQNRFKSNDRAAEAMFRRAELTLQTKRRGKEVEARQIYRELSDGYPSSNWAQRGILSKAALEEREKIREADPELGANVPAALRTYRLITQRYPSAAEAALWKLSELYEDVRRYDLAVQAVTDLVARFPSTKYDAWFRAGELYERRIKDRAKTREAYAQVPPSSPRYSVAQKKLAELSR